MPIDTHFARGDILYGLHIEKQKYFNVISPEKLTRCSSSYYHKSLSRGKVKRIKWNETTQCFRFSLSLFGPENSHQADFYAAFRKSKYNKSTLNKVSFRAIQRNGYHTLQPNAIWIYNHWDFDDDDLKNGILNNVVRRACKYTLWFVLHETFNKVHFTIDNLDIKNAVNRKHFLSRVGTKAPAITGSELKFLFRIWGYLEKAGLSYNVIFYKDNEVIPPPWLSNPEDWNQYARHLLKKHCSNTVTKAEIARSAFNLAGLYVRESRLCNYDLPVTRKRKYVDQF